MLRISAIKCAVLGAGRVGAFPKYSTPLALSYLRLKFVAIFVRFVCIRDRRFIRPFTVAQRENRKEFSIQRRVIWCMPTSRRSAPLMLILRKMSTGALPTAVGSPGTRECIFHLLKPIFLALCIFLFLIVICCMVR